MEPNLSDCVLFTAGLLILLSYHGWLIWTIRYRPNRTVIGLNAERRHQWVHCVMADPLKNGTLAIQALRNNMMASTQLATIAITLSSLITALVSSTLSNSTTTTGNNSSGSRHVLGVTITFTIMESKYLAVLLCFLLAFFCNMQAIRYYAHVSFLITLGSSQGKTESIEFVAMHLNQGSMFWSLGMRAFYLSFPLLLWIFGTIPMFLCCILLTCVLYFLDTTSHYTNGGGSLDAQLNTNHSSRGPGDSSIAFPLLVGAK